MHRTASIPTVLAVLAVTGCQTDSRPAQGAQELAAPLDPAQATSAQARDVARPDPAAVLRQYYAALNARDYTAAYAQWEGDGEASGDSFDDFKQGFEATRSIQLRITGPVKVEGAAGSLYATVPVEVDAALLDGSEQRFAGSYSLRRVNDVPGSSAAQRQWHIHSADLQER